MQKDNRPQLDASDWLDEDSIDDDLAFREPDAVDDIYDDIYDESAKPAATPPKPNVIAATVRDDDDLAPISDLLDDVAPEEFGDITPRRSRFSAPTANDVLKEPAKRGGRRQDASEAGQSPVRVADEDPSSSPVREPSDEETAAGRGEDKKKVGKQRKAARKAEKQRKTEEKSKSAGSDHKKHGRAGVVAGSLTAVALGAAVVLAATNISGGLPPSESDIDTASEDIQKTISDTDSSGSDKVDPEKLLASAADATCSEEGFVAEDGENTSPEGTIKGFNHAYFQTRDAEAAASFLDEKMYDSIESLQEGIDDAGNGDAYCLGLSPAEKENEFEATILEFQVEEDEVIAWRTDSTILVEEKDGAWVITSQTLMS